MGAGERGEGWVRGRGCGRWWRLGACGPAATRGWCLRRGLGSLIGGPLLLLFLNGLDRSRTDMPLRAVDFESTASANSATRPGAGAL